MQKNKLEVLSGTTSVLIAPGYRFHVVSGLITNFHQPNSTLLLLIAAFVGGDWKKIYDHALLNDYRFLSYGDSSILFRS
jgi:S-adenosylmethionine:tRNA ribosyltransferase-isomerase